MLHATVDGTLRQLSIIVECSWPSNINPMILLWPQVQNASRAATSNTRSSSIRAKYGGFLDKETTSVDKSQWAVSDRGLVTHGGHSSQFYTLRFPCQNRDSSSGQNWTLQVQLSGIFTLTVYPGNFGNRKQLVFYVIYMTSVYNCLKPEIPFI